MAGPYSTGLLAMLTRIAREARMAWDLSTILRAGLVAALVAVALGAFKVGPAQLDPAGAFAPAVPTFVATTPTRR